MKVNKEVEELIIDIMEYIIKKNNDNEYALAKEIYAVLTPLTLKGKEEKKYRRKLQDILKALRILGLVEMVYVPSDDYRGIPCFQTPAYRITEIGLKFLKMIKEGEINE
jgi:hypothetical protein